MSEIRFVAIELHLRRLDTALEELQLRLRGLESRVSRSLISASQSRLPLSDSRQSSPSVLDREQQPSMSQSPYSGE